MDGLALADPSPHGGYEPKFCIDVRSAHTPIHYPYRKNGVNIENDLTTTVAASKDSAHLPQRLAQRMCDQEPQSQRCRSRGTLGSSI